MSNKVLAFILMAVVASAGVLAFSPGRSEEPVTTQSAQALPVADSRTPDFATDNLYLDDFKRGYGDGFSLGVTGHAYPAPSSLVGFSPGYQDGLSQGYDDGREHQAELREQLLATAGTAAVVASPARVTHYAPARSTQTLGERVYRDDYVDRGMGTTARRALLIGGGAAAGAGLGGAIGGRKGALIGALVGGGTGTALAVTKKPNRAFDRKVSGKNVAIKTAIGTGAGAGIGALAGGKRGALAGAALGGGAGALWGVLDGKRTNDRR